MSNLYDMCLKGYAPAKRRWWSINIGGYGRYSFYGTKEEAAFSRDAKAEWEGGTGTMRKAKPHEIEEGLKNLRWQQERGYGLDTAEREALSIG